LNVVAEYRSGIGLPGNVPAMAISQLKTRPLGIRSVVNPSPAIGAADPETLDNARLNAPGSVKMLGRIVSLTDYEDFARGFAGVGKGQARELWSGQAKVVHLTIAPATDTMLDPGDTLVTNLRDAMERLRDPARPMILQPCARRYFALTAQVRVDSAFRLADVGLAARQKIATLFGYSARDLAQPVSAAEMIAALHAVAGVVAVDLDDLSVLLDGEGSHPLSVGLAAVLPALPARGPGQRGERTDFLPAELLTVLPSAVDLTMMEAIDA
jgi:predicted phage baseplate assembly protein